MEKLKYVKFERVSLKDNPEFNEKWLQDKIAEDPSILGLGDLILKDRERMQPRGGRLDLLFQEPELGTRYELEIQLGKTDESHIIRSLEYWDVERKRYPQYDHVCVVVAEDITSRFLNVISLFNGYIPIIALQMNALKYEDRVAIIFTKVLDQITLGYEEEEGELEEVDKQYWEKRGTHATVQMVDELFAMIRSIDPSFELKYNKYYIGLAQSGQPINFAIFRPMKNVVRLEVRLNKSDKTEQSLNELGLDLMDYSRDGRYRIRLSKDDIKKHEEFIKSLLQSAYSESQGR